MIWIRTNFLNKNWVTELCLKYVFKCRVVCLNENLKSQIIFSFLIWQNSNYFVWFRPIIVNFSFIIISCTQSLMRHTMIVWLFGKIFENFVFSSLHFLKQYNTNIFKLQLIYSNNLFIKKEIISSESAYLFLIF